MQLEIKIESGKNIRISINKKMSVASFKKIIVEQEKYAPHQTIKLIYKGIELTDQDELIEIDKVPYLQSKTEKINLSEGRIFLLLQKPVQHPLVDSSKTPISKPNLWQRHKPSFIVFGFGTVAAIAIVFNIAFPLYGIPMSIGLAAGLLTAAVLGAGTALFNIVYNEWMTPSQAPGATATGITENVEHPISTVRQYPEGIKMHYLLFDHGGVLDGESWEGSFQALDVNDLVLSKIDTDVYMVLKGGVIILNKLFELVTKYDCKLVFHSKNGEADQRRIWQQIKMAADQKKVPVPPVHAMAVYDVRKYPDATPEAPQVSMGEDSMMVVGYGQSERDGKACVRQALASALGIHQSARLFCTVFDDGASVIESARSEGYGAYLIGDNVGATKLLCAVEDLYRKLHNDPTSEYQNTKKHYPSVFDGSLSEAGKAGNKPKP